MSWYADPQLFIYSFTHVYRITKQFGNPVTQTDFKLQQTLNFSEHLSLANNKESDFEAFKATFDRPGISKLANSQGLVISWDGAKLTGTWSREEPNSPFWNLPGITKPKSVEEETLEKKEEKNSYLEGESAIEAENATLKAEIATLKAEVNREREETTGLKRDEILAAAGGGSSVEGPWITGHTVPSNWVPFGDLNVQPFSENIPLMITKATGGLKFKDDKTTNVQANHFYGGIFPIVVVDVNELITPNREEARFDPSVWSRYNNAGNSYATRKAFPSEMSIDAHKTC